MKKIIRKILSFTRQSFIKAQRYYWRERALLNIGGYETKPYVGGKTCFSRQTFLGKNTSFNGMQIGGIGKVTIGDYFHSGPECVIISQNHNYEGEKIPYDNVYIGKDVVIGDFVWLGRRVMIMPGAKIGDGAIIQAGSVVVDEIADYAIAGGHPAKVFSHRSKEHFLKLKKEGKFH